MEVNGNATAGVGMLVKALEVESLKGQVIGKTLQAMEQMQQTKPPMGADYQKMVMGAAGIGNSIDKIV
jgi:hypothetical protein